MKKIFFSITIILLLISCGEKKKVLTLSEFENIMKNNNYEVIRVIDNKLIPPEEKSVASKGKCKAEYLEGYPEGLFYLYGAYTNDLESSKKPYDKSKNITQDFFHGGSKYTLETGSDIKVIRLKGRTLIYAECPIDKKNELLKLIKQFG